MCIETLKGEGIEMELYWYNPNIHPFTEYKSRRDCLSGYAKSLNLALVVEDEYGLRRFIGGLRETENAGRCGADSRRHSDADGMPVPRRGGCIPDSPYGEAGIPGGGDFPPHNGSVYVSRPMRLLLPSAS
jgi:hypothetical protein